MELLKYYRNYATCRSMTASLCSFGIFRVQVYISIEVFTCTTWPGAAMHFANKCQLPVDLSA